MRNQQSGFTLVEIAIVLVIIGLLLGGVLKGQELINSAKVKNLASDFRTIPTYIYGYQDKFKALPGDDSAVVAHLPACTTPCQAGDGNGSITGMWDTVSVTDEPWQFWAHVRMANLAAGPTIWAAGADSDPFVPKNAVGGRLGISSMGTGQVLITGPVTTMTGTYQVCSKGIQGKLAKQLDVQMDDGNELTGSMRAIADSTTVPMVPGNATAITTLNEGSTFTVCLAF
jgi:prepilin-type N-terminal cleavage/methylation domain-containing protein